ATGSCCRRDGISSSPADGHPSRNAGGQQDGSGRVRPDLVRGHRRGVRRPDPEPCIDRPVAIPTSALHGDNVCRRSTAMPWYEGPTLIETLESAKPLTVVPSSFRMPCHYVI